MIYASYEGLVSGTALRDAGFGGTIRNAGTAGKMYNTTPAECASIREVGLELHGVFEVFVSDFLGGYDAGVVNARALLADADYCGIPGVLFMSGDMHIVSSDLPTWIAYLQGAKSVLGLRCGAFGYSEAIIAAYNSGIENLWQQGSHPVNTATLRFTNLWRRNIGVEQMKVSDVLCDISDTLRPLRFIPGDSHDSIASH